MGFFDDMTTALENYPVTHVQLEIIDVTFPGTVLNVSDEGTFRVKVINNGPLDLTGVTLKIKGLNGAQVDDSSAPILFWDEIHTGELPTIDGHGGEEITHTLLFKAPADAQASTNLIKATLDHWNASLDHILIDHSDPLDNDPKGSFAARVVRK